MAFYMLLLTVLATARATSDDSQAPDSHARMFTYTSQLPTDLQYDFSLLDPQLQYPQFPGGSSRVQPQVLIYSGGAPGQPFLLRPGAPPGNFLIPQPQPGFVFRDLPQGRPSVFASGYPKPAYVPPINKDAEEIPTNPGGLQPTPPVGRKPEKLETFDEKPQQPTGEADVLASVDRTLGENPSLKPGHRYFILNGQPLFSNYPLPQFANSPYQPALKRFGSDTPELYEFRQSGPSFLPEGFSKQQLNHIPPHKVPVSNFFVRNSITGQINSAKKQDYKNPQNEITHTQNFISFNQRNEPASDILLKNVPILPYTKQRFEQIPEVRNNAKEHPQLRDSHPNFNANPPVTPDENDSVVVTKLEDPRKIKEPAVVSAKPEPSKELTSEETPVADKSHEPSISRSQPSALALAGPGGIAAAAPRATALTGDKGISVSSPHATAIAGPSKGQIIENPTNKKERQH